MSIDPKELLTRLDNRIVITHLVHGLRRESFDARSFPPTHDDDCFTSLAFERETNLHFSSGSLLRPYAEPGTDNSGPLMHSQNAKVRKLLRTKHFPIDS